jgi:c-di-GMP-related signal transduction protein
MDIYVARQPIFNIDEQTVAYELLYRSSNQNRFQDTDGDKATTHVLVNSFMNIGIEEISNGKPCFVNFTENLLKLNVPTQFNPETIVVEILENIEITDDILRICMDLNQSGYKIALDDFFISKWTERTIKLLEYVHIIKMDFRATTRNERKIILRFIKSKNSSIEFLAEKVETLEEYEEAKEDGFTYFQGFYFSKPVIFNSYDIPGYYHSYFQILSEIEKPEPDIVKIKDVIERDISLSFKLLKLINNPAAHLRKEVSSIKQAIVLLGLTEIKKWIYVLMIRGADTAGKDSKEKEIIHFSLIRGKLGELIGGKIGGEILASKYFLLGIFSLMDTLLHIPMTNLLNDLPLSSEIKEALAGQKNEEAEILHFLINIEQAFYHGKEIVQNPTDLSDEELFGLYAEASDWATKILNDVMNVAVATE